MSWAIVEHFNLLFITRTLSFIVRVLRPVAAAISLYTFPAARWAMIVLLLSDIFICIDFEFSIPSPHRFRIQSYARIDQPK